MAKREYVYAESYGAVYRFTARRWQKMLEVVAAGGVVNYDDYGTIICIIGHNITDLDAEFAIDLLLGLKS